MEARVVVAAKVITVYSGYGGRGGQIIIIRKASYLPHSRKDTVGQYPPPHPPPPPPGPYLQQQQQQPGGPLYLTFQHCLQAKEAKRTHHYGQDHTYHQQQATSPNNGRGRLDCMAYVLYVQEIILLTQSYYSTLQYCCNTYFFNKREDGDRSLQWYYYTIILYIVYPFYRLIEVLSEIEK